MHGFARLPGEMPVERLHVARIGAEPRADGRAAHADLEAPGPHGAQLSREPLHEGGVAAEFLPEREGEGVLPAGAARLHDAAEGLRLGGEGGLQGLDARNDAVELGRNGEVRGRRDRVVRRLRLVDVRVRMHDVLALAAGQDFVRRIADHFVHVHVDARVAASLPHVEREFAVEFAREPRGRRPSRSHRRHRPRARRSRHWPWRRPS